MAERRAEPLSVYEDELDRQRAAALTAISLTFAVLGLGGIAALRFAVPGMLPPGAIVPNVVMAAAYAGLALLAQRGALRAASVGFVLLALLVPAVQSIPYTLLRPEIAALSYVVAVVAAAFLLGPGWSVAAALVAAALVAAGLIAHLPGGPGQIVPLMQGSGDLTPIITLAEAVFLLGMTAFLALLLSRSLLGWAASAQRRARQLAAAAVVSETAAAAASLRDLLNEVVERIREAYGFYHAQVFLVDREARLARLEASTGRAGEALLQSGHALPVGSQSVVGQCTASGEPVVVNDVRASAIHRPNELLPNTRAELALPLRVGEDVIGALDVQSVERGAFLPTDVNSLQVMATQLTAAIDKARLVDELQARATENERLFEEAQRTLRQVDDLNKRLTREGWRDYLRTRRAGGVGYSLFGENVHTDDSWSAPMRQAYQGGSGVVVRQEREANIAALPVRVRGEVIGVLEVARDGDHPWSEAELEMAEALVERLALAIENARLFEQASSAAEREQLASRIAEDVQSARSVDEVLRSALSELGEVLGASRGVVQISPPGADDTGTRKESGAQGGPR
jgi:GAF domain-containing protein